MPAHSSLSEATEKWNESFDFALKANLDSHALIIGKRRDLGAMSIGPQNHDWRELVTLFAELRHELPVSASISFLFHPPLPSPCSLSLSLSVQNRNWYLTISADR